MNWNDIFLNVLISITASLFFWLATFKISYTRVIFSMNLAKPDNTITDVRKSYGYRVRFANIGLRDLIEVSVAAKLIILDGARDYIFNLDVSNSGEQYFIPFLPGIITNRKKKRSNMRIITLYFSESMLHELTKSKHPEKIRKLAESGEIQFKDIFDKYGENATIRVYVYGNDQTTGARKMFESCSYNMYNIEEGDFLGTKRINISLLDSKKVKQDKISQIHKKSDIVS